MSFGMGGGTVDAERDRRRLVEDLAAVASQDRPALRRVYAATSAKLYGVCLRILADESEAEDVLQEIYVTVWRRAGSFDPARGVSPITWLAAMARNRAIDRLRARRDGLNRPLELAAEIADDRPSALDRLDQVQDAARLNACLGELEASHAAAVRGAFFDGHTYASLAQAAEVPLGTMKSWIRRSLQRLKSCLDA